jgi:hypothetical protein
MAGVVILPADPERAKEYEERAAAADKWLHEDGSITDSAGRVIKEADAGRALEYAARMPGAAQFPMSGGGSGSKIADSIAGTFLMPLSDFKEALAFDGFALSDGEGGAHVLFPLYNETRHGDEPVEPNRLSAKDEGGATLL